MADSARSGDERFGRALQSRRKELGLTRRDLVAASGLSYPYISQLETGYRLPSQKSLHRLAHALEMAPADLSAAIAFEPQRAAALAVAASPDSASWRANPAFRERGTATPLARKVSSTDEAVEAAELISALPLEKRLAALAEVQQQVIDQLVEDRARRGA